MIAATSNRSAGRNTYDDSEENFLLHGDSLQIKLKDELVIENVSVILVIYDVIAKAVGNAVISHMSMERVGTVTDDKNYGEIFATKDLTKIAISFNCEVPEAGSHTLSSSILAFNPKHILILDGYGRHNIRSQQSNEKQIMYLQTSSTSASNSPKSVGIAPLEVGAIVVGFTSEILVAAEMRGVSVAALLAFRESSYTISSAASFEIAWPLLLHLFENTQIPLPTQADYKNGLRRDPFLGRTENLYP